MTPHAVAIDLARRLREAGHVALFAGGCVRDPLLGAEPKDYDIATSARPGEVLALFPGGNQVGAHFGVILVRRHDINTEIATFRSDGAYLDGRHPQSVTFSDPQHDARRRDFTINGLYQDPEDGRIIDYVGGRADLQARTIRAIGEPGERFEEDGLRLLRAIRFATTLEFEIEATTWQAILDHAGRLDRISPERIRDEFSRILVHPRRDRGLELLLKSGLLAVFLPEAVEMDGCEQPPEWHPEGDVFTHTRLMLELLGECDDLDLCLATLLHDIGKPPTKTWDERAERLRFNGHDRVGAEMAETILKRLRYPNATIEAVVGMIANHMRFMHVQEMRTAKLKRFMARPTFGAELELHRVDCESSNGFTDNLEFLIAKREEFANEPLIPPPLITGHDLIKRGLHPGPIFKQILAELQTEQLEGRISDRDAATKWLDQRIPHPPAPGAD